MRYLDLVHTLLASQLSLTLKGYLSYHKHQHTDSLAGMVDLRDVTSVEVSDPSSSRTSEAHSWHRK